MKEILFFSKAKTMLKQKDPLNYLKKEHQILIKINLKSKINYFFQSKVLKNIQKPIGPFPIKQKTLNQNSKDKNCLTKLME
jgi:hypothetical protein